MIASPTAAPTRAGYGSPRRRGFVPHGRYRPRAQRRVDQVQLDIFLIARRRAAEFGRVSFVVSHWSNRHWNVVFADKFHPTPDDIIEYVAWPPGWRYRPRGDRHHGRTNLRPAAGRD
jgi:hypothetical protein